MAQTRVLVIYVGGTFGMTPDTSRPGAPLRPRALEDLRHALPDIGALWDDLSVEFLTFETFVDSSNMVPDDWVRIATTIEMHYDAFDGFVVIQGTDTLAYTASALSFMFENLTKPVVVTGSQLPLLNARSDARLNYLHAVSVAGYRASDLPCIPEVIVVFADRILRGCRVRKMSASSWVGFESPNCPAIGEIGEHIRIHDARIRRPSGQAGPFRVNTALNADVLDLSIFPGLDAKKLDRIMRLEDVSGIVLRTYGSGNAPEGAAFLEAVRAGVADGETVVVNITQCPEGAVEMGLYAASVGLMEAGVISGLDMTPEAALTKLMVLLGKGDIADVRRQMQISQRGEQSLDLFEFDLGGRAARDDAPFETTITPDARFDLGMAQTVSLRIKGLEMVAPDAPGTRLEIRLNGCAIPIPHVADASGTPVDVIENLPTEAFRAQAGQVPLRIEIAASGGAGFGFQDLMLRIMAKAR